MNKVSLQSEAGFSMIELLTITLLVLILSGLSIVAFNTYKQSAWMASGDNVYHNARTKLAISELDLPDGYMLDMTRSATDGTMFSGELANLLPGMTAGNKVRLSVSLAVCDESSDPLDLNQLIVIEPCLAVQKIQWEKFCGGIEVMSNRMSNPLPCA